MTSGSYNVDVDVNGCVGSDTINVTINPAPTLDLGNDTTICSGNNIVLDAGLGNDTYIWSTGAQTQTITVNTAGTYIVEVGSNGPSGTNLVTNGDFSSGGTSWTASGNTTEAWGSEITYGGSNPANTNVAEIDPGTDGIAGTADDMWLCQSIAGFTIGQNYDLCFNYSRRNIGPNPMDVIITIDGGALSQLHTATNAIFGFTQICFSFTATQTTHLLSFSPGPSLNNGLGMIIDDVTILDPPTPLCTASDTIQVFVETPVQLVTSVDPICDGDSNGEIHIDNALAIEYSSDGGINWQIDSFFLNLPEGNYNICSRTALGCLVCETITLNDAPPVNITISPDITICENGTTDLLANVTGGTTFLYNWDSTVSTAPMQTVSPTVTTTYNVFAENELGCLSASIPVTVTLLPPLSGTISPDIDICVSDQVQINSTVTSGIGPYTFTWSNGTVNTSAGIDQITVSPAVTTDYSVTITDACGSTPIILTMTVNVTPAPVPQYLADNTTQCEPGIFELYNNTNPNLSQSVTWIINNEVYVNQDVVITSPLPTGTYSIQMIVTSPAGCIDSALFNNVLTVEPNPDANFSYSPNPVHMFNTDVTFNNGSYNADSYQWYFEDGEPSTSTNTNSQTQFPDGVVGSYEVILIATTDFGCADTATQIIEVLPEVLIYAPNSFTPDGDEFNQSWNVYMDGVDIFSFDLTIYNRWGETIWESHDIEVGWDGTYNGNIVPTGVYTWIVHVKDQINDGKYSFNGHINLLR
jgi:gliding motility-associated-like protein